MSAYAKNYGYFFNSSSGDRTYNAESFEDWLKPFFLSGVFNGELQVKAQTTPDMTVKVTAGHANLDGKAATWETDNTMQLAVSSGVYDRIDTIVLRRDNVNRTISIEVVTGTASGSPQPTAPTRDADTFELVLAEVYVGTGVTAITQANITDKRMDSTVCGWVAATVDQIDFDQIQAQYDAWQEETQEFFTDWFEAIRGQLDEDAAGHLQNEVDDINTNIFGFYYLIVGNTAYAELNPGMFVKLKDSTIAGKADGYYAVLNHIADGATVVGSDLMSLDTYGALNIIDQTHVNKRTDLVDNLTSTATNMALSANQGKVLNDKITTTAVTDLTLTNVVSGGHVYAWKAGSVVTLTFDFTVSTAAATLTLTTLPIGYEPKGNITQLLKVLGNPSGDYYLTLDATTRELKCYSGTKTRLIGMITFVGK